MGSLASQAAPSVLPEVYAFNCKLLYRQLGTLLEIVATVWCRMMMQRGANGEQQGYRVQTGGTRS
jgi:hypothetical protein